MYTVSEKALESRVCTEPLKLNNKKATQIKNEQVSE